MEEIQDLECIMNITKAHEGCYEWQSVVNSLYRGYRSGGIIAKIRQPHKYDSGLPPSRNHGSLSMPYCLSDALRSVAHWHIAKRLGPGLLVQVGLNTTLLSLALIMLGLELCLVGLVASDASNSTTDSARDTVGNTRAEI
jgi:hypothetical protein